MIDEFVLKTTKQNAKCLFQQLLSSSVQYLLNADFVDNHREESPKKGENRQRSKSPSTISKENKEQRVTLQKQLSVDDMVFDNRSEYYSRHPSSMQLKVDTESSCTNNLDKE